VSSGDRVLVESIESRKGESCGDERILAVVANVAKSNDPMSGDLRFADVQAKRFAGSIERMRFPE
jgi:hypothetical protein